eukprot:Phypoly_transcript_07401.p1 GENE.Phypoly_transcript_07401~~Phypoly_transcript_07401.p1  ORF type:complete len:442 (+),score=28.14 Phypoly_transcript_07401:202-1527(+)
MEFFTSLFALLLLVCVGTEFVSRRDSGKKHVEATPGFRSFQITYLVVYLINMGADWLQGPYIYALYEFYGFKKDEIAILFLCGFFSSMVFGTFVGAIADKYGRRNMAVMFGVIYGLSCITKLYGNFYILLLGRLLGGVSTSLLFSVFESWMVYEHHKRGYSTEGLSQTFSYATFGNGCVAILASLAASFVAERYGLVAPYMLSLALLMLGIVYVLATWTENYGDATVDISGTFTNAVSAFRSDIKILILGIVQSLFEASMYTFVFMWTPALTEGDDTSPLPFGLIFACYMVAIMIGSSIFKICVMKFNIQTEVLAKYIFGIGAVSLFIPTVTTSRSITAISFIVFEIVCGMYWPCLGTIRGKYIPESSRSAIMNFFRVPLNLLVVIVLIKVSSFSNSTVFLVCTSWLLIALGGQYKFTELTSAYQEKRAQAESLSEPFENL